MCLFSPGSVLLCWLTLLQEVKQVLGDKFELVTAFSREGSKKVYVQHRLKERAKEINALLDQKAFFYVCGDAANMAREVNATLAQILADERGISKSKAEEMVKQTRASNQYQVCTRCQLFPHFRQCLILSNRRTYGNENGVYDGNNCIRHFWSSRDDFASGRHGT